MDKEKLKRKLREIFPDGNYIAHGTSPSFKRGGGKRTTISTFRSAVRIIKHGYLISHLQAMKEGMAIEKVATTELAQISCCLNRSGAWGDIIFLFPITGVLKKGVYLEKGIDPYEVRVVPEGYERVLEEKSFELKGAMSMLEDSSVLSLQGWKEYYNRCKENTKEWIENIEESLPGGRKVWDSRTIEKHERQLEKLKKELDYYKTFQTCMEYLFTKWDKPKYVNRVGTKDWRDLEPTIDNIMAYAREKELKGRMPKLEEISSISASAKKLAVKLSRFLVERLNLPDVKIPIENSIMFVPEKQLKYWKNFAKTMGHEPHLILPYPTGHHVTVGADAMEYIKNFMSTYLKPSLNVDLFRKIYENEYDKEDKDFLKEIGYENKAAYVDTKLGKYAILTGIIAPKIKKIVGKFNTFGKCVGYKVYDCDGNVVYEFDLERGVKGEEDALKKLTEEVGKEAEEDKEVLEKLTEVAKEEQKKESEKQKEKLKKLVKEVKKVA